MQKFNLAKPRRLYRTRRALENSIRRDWVYIVGSAIEADGGLRERLRRAAVDSLPAGRMGLASTSSKISKGERHGILTSVIYLAPAGEAARDWRTICPHSTAGCRAGCLVSSGMLAMTPARDARLWRTALYLGAPARFWLLAAFELESLARRAARSETRMTPAFRVNGTSDIATPADFIERAAELGVTLYGYTKDPERAEAFADEVYSWDGREETISTAEAILNAGGRVSVVLDVKRGAPLPETWRGFPIVDGDRTDAVFTQPRGTVLGLRLKGVNRAKKAARRSGFAQGIVDGAEVSR